MNLLFQSANLLFQNMNLLFQIKILLFQVDLPEKTKLKSNLFALLLFRNKCTSTCKARALMKGKD